MDEKLKNHLKEAGYVDFGYISPEISSKAEYPEYIQKNVRACIQKIQAHQNRTSITFGLWADVHFSPSINHNIRMKRAVNAYTEISNKVHCDYLVLNGDHCNDGVKEYKMDSYRELRKFIKEFNYLPSCGNHDFNSIWDEILENETFASKLSAEELYALFFNHLPSLGARFSDSEGFYYYIDDQNKNVRYIFLDTSDVPHNCKNNVQHLLCISQKQLDWLIEDALNVKENTDILLFAHDAVFPTKEQNIEQKNLMMLNSVLDAYKNAEKLSAEFGEDEFKIKADIDFGKCRRGNIVALFAGHHHDDIIEYSKNGIPFIYTANFMMYPAKEHLPRLDGKKTELLFDVVTINREEKIVYLTRVGSGKDRAFKYEKFKL